MHILTERSQSEKAKYLMILKVWHYGKGKAMETLKGLPGVEGVEVEG